MKTIKRLGILLLILPLIVLFAMLADFYFNTSYPGQPFYADLFLLDFAASYLQIETPEEEKNTLSPDECNHMISREGIKPDLKNWRLVDQFEYYEEQFLFINTKPENYVEPAFSIYNIKTIGQGQNIEFSIRNYTGHAYTYWIEKYVQGEWQKIQVELINEDSITNGLANTLDIIYWVDNNPDQHNITYDGTYKEYLFSGTALQLGEYRMVVHLESHGEFISEFEVVENRPFEWKIEKEAFFNPDSLIFSIKNTSDERLYHISWYRLEPVLVYNVRIYKNGIAVNSYENGYDCGTGLDAFALYSNEEMQITYGNLLTYNPFVAEPDIVNYFKEQYGDSIKIQFQLYAIPAGFRSKYKAQDILSPEITLDTEELLSKWVEYRKKQGETNPRFSQLIK